MHTNRKLFTIFKKNRQRRRKLKEIVGLRNARRALKQLRQTYGTRVKIIIGSF